MILLPLAAIVAGLVIELTLEWLLGPLLIVGGVGALFWAGFAGGIDRVASWLSVGMFNRRPKS
jgi:hypothetical protein